MVQQRRCNAAARANASSQVLTSRGEVVGAGDLGFAGFAAVERVALVIEAGSRCFVYAAIN